MKKIYRDYINYYRNGHFDSLDNGVGIYLVTKEDILNNELLRPFSYVRVSPVGSGYSVEVF